MEIKYLRDMKSGWFAGNFEPSAFKCDYGEVAVKKYCQHQIESALCHPTATVMYMLLSGSIQLNGNKISQPYEMVIFEPGEHIYLTSLADSDVLIFVLGDNYFIRGKDINLEKLIMAYSCYYEYGEDREIKFDTNELTFVVQGAVDNITPVCIESIRHFFPDSTIIFSTEYGQIVNQLDYDLLVEIDDVGGIPIRIDDPLDASKFNLNRQLASTVAGLKRVKTKYTMKIRSDMVLTGRRFATYLHEYPQRVDKMRLFNERIIISESGPCRSLHELNKELDYILPILFHPSDHFLLGLTEDLKNYFFGTRFINDYEVNSWQLKNESLHYLFSNSILSKNDIININLSRQALKRRYDAEQYIAIEALERKYPGIKDIYQDWSDWNIDADKLSNYFIGNNFIILDLLHHGIILPKHEINLTYDLSNEYNCQSIFKQRIFELFYNTVICEGIEDF